MSILKGSSYSPSRGGHAPGDVRNAFVDEAIPAYIAWEDGEPEPTVELREQQVSISQLCGLLWNCHDILPSGAIFELDGCDADLKSQTYASAARWMKAECTRQLAKPERSVADIR
jgi:hypothetical protein